MTALCGRSALTGSPTWSKPCTSKAARCRSIIIPEDNHVFERSLVCWRTVTRRWASAPAELGVGAAGRAIPQAEWRPCRYERSLPAPTCTVVVGHPHRGRDPMPLPRDAIRLFGLVHARSRRDLDSSGPAGAHLPGRGKIRFALDLDGGDSRSRRVAPARVALV